MESDRPVLVNSDPGAGPAWKCNAIEQLARDFRGRVKSGPAQQMKTPDLAASLGVNAGHHRVSRRKIIRRRSGRRAEHELRELISG